MAVLQTRESAERLCSLDRWMRHRPVLTIGAFATGGVLAILGVVKLVKHNENDDREHESPNHRRGITRKIGRLFWTTSLSVGRNLLLNNDAMAPIPDEQKETPPQNDGVPIPQ